MFGTRWPLFRLLGIPIRVDASWLIILALLTWTFVNFFGAAVFFIYLINNQNWLFAQCNSF